MKACPRLKCCRGPAFRSKSALVVPPRLRAIRCNPSRGMRAPAKGSVVLYFVTWLEDNWRKAVKP